MIYDKTYVIMIEKKYLMQLCLELRLRVRSLTGSLCHHGQFLKNKEIMENEW